METIKHFCLRVGFLGEIPLAILLLASRLFVIREIFPVKIGIKLCNRRLCHRQREQVIDQPVGSEGRQVLVVLKEGRELLHDPFVYFSAEITHLGFHNDGRLLKRPARQTAVVGLIVVFAVCSHRQGLGIKVAVRDLLNKIPVDGDSRCLGIITDIQRTIFVIKELSPSVGRTGQHVIETLVILYQVREDMLTIDALLGIVPIIQEPHVSSIVGHVPLFSILFSPFFHQI